MKPRCIRGRRRFETGKGVLATESVAYGRRDAVRPCIERRFWSGLQPHGKVGLLDHGPEYRLAKDPGTRVSCTPHALEDEHLPTQAPEICRIGSQDVISDQDLIELQQDLDESVSKGSFRTLHRKGEGLANLLNVPYTHQHTTDIATFFIIYILGTVLVQAGENS